MTDHDDRPLRLEYSSVPPAAPRSIPSAVPRRCAVGFLVLLLLLGLGALLLHFALRPSIAPTDAARAVEWSLTRWGAIDAERDRSLRHSNGEPAATPRIRGINGMSDNIVGGGGGEGTDYYEVELSPAFAAELRAWLARSSTVTKYQGGVDKPGSPSWWPPTWPPGTQIYQFGQEDLILPAAGTRAWFVGHRT